MYRKTIRAGEISRERQEVAHGRGRTIQVPLYVTIGDHIIELIIQ